MILDTIDNARLYAGLNPCFPKAFEILKDQTMLKRQDGKYPVDGEKTFYTIQRYTTRPINDGKFEAHRKYIDIQFLLSGIELLGYAPLKGLTVAKEYNPEKDIAFFHPPKDFTKVMLEPGLFCILFPNDAHLPALGEVSPLGGPGCHLALPSDVRKVVVKIKL